MPQTHLSRHTTATPTVDLLTHIFTSTPPAARTQPQYFDAFNPSRHYSLADAQALVTRLGLGLQQLGLQPDDKLLLYAENNLYFPVLLWGCIAAQAVLSACAPAATVDEVAYQLCDCEARVLLASPAVLPKALAAAQAVGIPRARVFVFGDPAALADGAFGGLQPWTALWAAPEAVRAQAWHWWTSRDAAELARKTVVINYSSGTTGPPKGVEITHANILANATQLLHVRSQVAATPSARARAARLEAGQERWLAPLPMYHAYGQLFYSFSAPLLGAKVYVMHRYDIHTLLTFLDVFRITTFTGVPVMLVQLAKQDPARYNLSAIEFAGSGSAPLGAALAAQVAARFFKQGVEVKQGWGMTELTCSMTGFAHDDVNDGRSVGFLLPNCAARIVPVGEEAAWEGVNDAPADVEVGEVWVAGPNVMKGYYKRPEQTRATVVEADGRRWLRTGDVGYFDAEGKLFIVDRVKELIKVKGLQVAPAELEAAILEHPGVGDAAIVGTKLADGGEYPRAFVVRRDAQLTAATVAEIVQRRFAKHKWLTGGVYFIEEIPRTPSGKVMRRRLPEVRESKL